MRGFDVVYDEFDFIEPDEYEKVLPSLDTLKVMGKIIVLTTPKQICIGNSIFQRC